MAADLTNPGRSCEASSLGNHCNVARPVYDANDHDRIGMRQVIDGIGTVKRDPKARSKLLPSGTGKREMSKRLKGCLDRADKARRDLLRRLGRQSGPDFGEVSLSRIG